MEKLFFYPRAKGAGRLYLRRRLSFLNTKKAAPDKRPSRPKKTRARGLERA
jgi:hypothetical protein